MKSLKGKTVYISGGSSGIGLSIAEQFAEEEASVVIFSRDPKKLENAAAKIKSLTGHVIKTVVLDVTKHEEVNKSISGIISETGAPDFLINCAGIAQPDYFERITYENFKQTIDTNLTGAWNFLSAAVPSMKAKGGQILVTSSVAGFVGTFGYTAYSASKFGLIGLAETLRCELKPHKIRVSVLCPPDTDTPGFEEENKTKPAETIAISGNVKLMSPERVAKTAINGLLRKRFLIIPGFMGKITFILKSLFPALVFKIMDNDVRNTARERLNNE